MSVSVIIPALNEAVTVGRVVEVAREAGVDEVIVVSDGSTDETAARAREAGAIVVELSQRHGKGGAVIAGLAVSHGDIILLMDADLIGIRPEHVRALLLPVLEGKAVMTVGLRDRGFLVPLMRFLPLVGGERALRREVLEGLDPMLVQGFRLEVGMNAAAKKRGAVTTVFLPGLHIKTKIQKIGLLRGLVGYAKMWKQVAIAFWKVRNARY